MAQRLSKQELTEKLNQVNLVCVDLNLFLDTHPDCKEALDDFNRANTYYRELVDEYETRFGPLIGFGLTKEMKEYNWCKGPWPWEPSRKGGNR